MRTWSVLFLWQPLDLLLVLLMGICPVTLCARIIGNSSPRLTDVFSDLCYHVSYLAIITIVE